MAPSALADLPAQLRAYRMRHVLTQAEMAALLGCSLRSLQGYEADTAFPRPALRRRIAALFAEVEAAA